MWFAPNIASNGVGVATALKEDAVFIGLNFKMSPFIKIEGETWDAFLMPWLKDKTFYPETEAFLKECTTQLKLSLDEFHSLMNEWEDEKRPYWRKTT